MSISRNSKFSLIVHSCKGKVIEGPFRNGIGFKIGGAKEPVTDIPLMQVEMEVEGARGNKFTAKGAMTAMQLWVITSARECVEAGQQFSVEEVKETLAAVFLRICDWVNENGPKAGCLHPVEHYLNWREEFQRIAAEYAAEKGWNGLPKMVGLVCSAAIDAALLDGLGLTSNRNPMKAFNIISLGTDLSRRVSQITDGMPLSGCLLSEPRTSIPRWHTHGIGNPVEEGEVEVRAGDNRPDFLRAYLEQGARNIKTKVNGNRENDLAALRSIDAALGEGEFSIWLDFNEAAPSVDYVVELLERLRDGDDADQRIFARIECVEQPFPREHLTNAEYKVHRIVELKPCAADESLGNYEDVQLIKDAGYNVLAVKACKGIIETLLCVALGRKLGMKLAIMDLTVYSHALIQSLNLAAWLKFDGMEIAEGVPLKIEANGIQFLGDEAFYRDVPEALLSSFGLDGNGDIPLEAIASTRGFFTPSGS